MLGQGCGHLEVGGSWVGTCWVTCWNSGVEANNRNKIKIHSKKRCLFLTSWFKTGSPYKHVCTYCETFVWSRFWGLNDVVQSDKYLDKG